MDYDFDDEIIIEDDINYNILGNDVLQNFPFIEDDVDALTDYELISRTYEYLDDKKANKEDIPNLDEYYNKDEVNDLLDGKVDNEELDNYYNKTEVNSLLDEKADISDIPDVSGFITKDVNDLTYYTKTSDLSEVATSGDYDDLTNKPTIPDVSNFITKDVNDLTNYTTSSVLTTLLSGKENNIDYGYNTNGYYVKFDSGLLIMWGTSNFTGGNTYTSVTFPISLFSTGTSYMLASKRYGSGSTAIYNYAITPQINDANSGFIYVKAQDGSNVTGDQKIDWLVLGRWK